jgi:hypothetical protein
VTFDGEYYPQVARGCPRATLEDYSMYYTEEELTQALERARVKIDKITERTSEYTRGTNDCFALFLAYDEELRGKDSKARDLITFRWKSTREFVVKLARTGLSIEDYAVECGYKLIHSKRPLLGDLAFEQGAMLNDGSFWVSTNENNTGTYKYRQVQFLERNVSLGRPIRS